MNPFHKIELWADGVLLYELGRTWEQTVMFVCLDILKEVMITMKNTRVTDLRAAK